MTERKAPNAGNLLANEQSPYLLQHADNPVAWRPWGEEAFARARDQDKPVFLSIGYATCPWCHVMERESFEDEQVAELLNRHFVSIKVDREERPDIDHFYMQATQAMTGSGGWPMSLFLAPDKRPFFAGTYFPKRSRGAVPGFLDLLHRIADLWRSDRARLLDAAGRATEGLGELARTSEQDARLTADVLRRARDQLERAFDASHGGFGSAPKFPTPHTLSFLLRCYRRDSDAEALGMVEKTLTAMRLGGVYDQVGFGLHRYATDRHWLVPHFEKMLCDQALFALANVEAYQATGKDLYARTAREVLAYVLRDLTSADGAFSCAEDADSEGVEGKFYVWTPEAVRAVLGAQEGDLFNRVYHIEKGGNFRDQATGQPTGESIPHLDAPPDQLAADLDMEPGHLRARMAAWREALFAAREERPRPLRDDKVLTAWNGLMIAALARAARALAEPSYAGAAARAGAFVLDNLREDERLLRRFRGGEARMPAVLEDYAFLAWGLLELHQAQRDPRWLRECITLTDAMLARFTDPQGGALYVTAADAQELPARLKEGYDGALPSGNSVAAYNLVRLARLTGRTEYDDRAQGIFAGLAAQVRRAPAGFTQLLIALDFSLGPSREIVVAGAPQGDDTRRLLSEVDRRLLPNAVLLLKPPGPHGAEIAELAPFTRPHTRRGRATAYVCRDFACREPVTDPEALGGMLDA